MKRCTTHWLPLKHFQYVVEKPVNGSFTSPPKHRVVVVVVVVVGSVLVIVLVVAV